MYLKDCEKPLNTSVISLLPTSTFEAGHDLKGDGKECVICIEEFKANERMLTLTCFHKFHEKCVHEWFKTQDFCPVCREKIKA